MEINLIDFALDSWDRILANFPSFIAALVVSILCGLLIGFERESRGKPAGMRTLVLICLGSAIFVQMSKIMTTEFGDPSRIAAQVVSGIGFLGAGAILQQSHKGYIAGMTTAASIWVTAAIGIVVGAEKYFLAFVAAGTVYFALRLLRWVETFLFHTRRIEERKITFEHKKGKTEWRLRGQLEEHMISPEDYDFIRNKEESILTLRFNEKNRNHRGFLADIATWKEVDSFES